jgi:beta-N-acetylhexosaminidase
MNEPASLGEKIGQMLLIGFRGCEIRSTDPIARDIAERNLGGVVLFDQEMSDTTLRLRNIKSVDQVRALTGSLQQRAGTPLIIAIDQEGGRVNRLKADYGFPPSISHEELGAINDPQQTFAQAEITARTLVEVGVNLNLAPVVDLDAGENNPIIKGKKRSFSSDPLIVARHAVEYCRAHHKRGVMTCAKHFPGHGSARADTHLGLVDVTQYWTEQELIPFQKLIEAGECDTIMTAHIFNAKLDPDRPATLSRQIVQGILRERLGFDGVVVSDDMEMKAIAGHYGLEEALRRGIEAGVDVLCFGNNMNFDAHIGEKVAGIIERLVESGTISEARIDQSFQRIQKLKQRYLAS